jgi:hypothetical protein
MDNMGLGMAIGIALGAALGAAFGSQRGRRPSGGSPSDDSDPSKG